MYAGYAVEEGGLTSGSFSWDHCCVTHLCGIAGGTLAVRKMLQERGVKPEQLPPADDVKKVQRKLESEEKKVIQSAKQNKKK